MGHTPQGPGFLWKGRELFWEDVAAILYLTGRRVYRGEDKGTVGRGNSINRYGASDKVASWRLETEKVVQMDGVPPNVEKTERKHMISTAVIWGAVELWDD